MFNFTFNLPQSFNFPKSFPISKLVLLCVMGIVIFIFKFGFDRYEKFDTQARRAKILYSQNLDENMRCNVRDILHYSRRYRDDNKDYCSSREGLNVGEEKYNNILKYEDKISYAISELRTMVSNSKSKLSNAKDLDREALKFITESENVYNRLREQRINIQKMGDCSTEINLNQLKAASDTFLILDPDCVKLVP